MKCRRIRPWSPVRVVGAALVLLAGLPAESRADIVPDFALLDTNPSSSSYDEPVSPRDFLQQMSAWYFGHST